jgi:hypothetical protein
VTSSRCSAERRPRGRRAAEYGQQFPPSGGDCHTPLPCEARKRNDTTPRARCPNLRGPRRGRGGTPSTGLNGSPTRTTLRLAFKSCLLCPRKRPYSGHRWTSRKVPQSVVSRCSKRCAPNAPLFDHLVGTNEGHWGDGDANCSCSPEVQDQFELGRLLNRQVGGLCSFGDTTHIVCSASEHRGEV